MKEYKVINWKMGFSNNSKKLEDLLNLHASSGWNVIHVAEHTTRIILERTKNR